MCPLFIFVYVSQFITRDILASISVVDKGIFPLEKDSVAIQFYLDIENLHPARTCKVISWPDKCHINIPKDSDCGIKTIYGTFNGFVRGKERETLVFVLPAIYQHDLLGSCDVHLLHQCDRSKKYKSETIEILLDTRVSRKTTNDLLVDYVSDRKKETCDSIDDNALESCDPANCDLKYLGAKSYFNDDMRRCTEVTACVSDVAKELPDTVYLPNINMCRDYDHPITLADIYAISTRMGVVTEQPKYKQEEFVELRSNCSTISQNLFLLRDMLNGKLCKMTGGSDYSKCCESAILAILSCIGLIFVLVLGFIFLLSFLLWLWKKWSDGDIDNLFQRCKCKFKKPERTYEDIKRSYSFVDKKVRNNLLQDVIVKDIPLELRDGAVNLCDRIGLDVRQKKRYRRSSLGSQVSLNDGEGDSSNVSSDRADDKHLTK